MLHTKTAQIDRHVNSLVKLFGFTDEGAHEKAYRKYLRLKSLENKAHKAAEDYCNIPNFDWDKAHENIEYTAKKIFDGNLPEGFFINGDPRGYALKIESDNLPEGFYKDWGGYGILAPDFS